MSQTISPEKPHASTASIQKASPRGWWRAGDSGPESFTKSTEKRHCRIKCTAWCGKNTKQLKQPQAVYDLLELTVPVQLPETQTMVLELVKNQRGTIELEIIDKAVEIVMQAENFLAKSLLRRKQPLLA